MEVTPLSEKLFNYIEQSKGWFALDEVYRTLCVTEERDKNNIRVQLHKLADPDKGVIEKHRTLNGRYRKLEITKPDPVDFGSIDRNKTTEVYLPFHLEDFMKVFNQNIIIFSGVSNYGKTEMLMLCAYLNQHHKGVYLNTEMDAVEQLNRIENYQPHTAWRNTEFPKRVLSEEIPALVERYYKDHYVFIDYLTADTGEQGYLSIARDINRLGNGIRDGIIFIGLQKNKGVDHARGGQGTLDLPRLYINLDPGPTDIDGSYSYQTIEMTIVKCKSPKPGAYNPNGWKFTFRLIHHPGDAPTFKIIAEPSAYTEYNNRLKEQMKPRQQALDPDDIPF